ncbi:ras protein [Mycena olivaceomarginata]|nr:ras protein [Mycena olivaceomarginata]
MDQWQVAILGDGGVGKTALAVQTYDPTIEDAYRKQFIVCFVEVIDTAGQEDYATLRDQWVREGQGFILVYSIESRKTLDRLKVFYESVTRVKGGKPDYRAGRQQREVSKEEGAQLARALGWKFVEASTRTAQNIDRIFANLIRTLRSGAAIEGPAKEKRRSVWFCKGGGWTAN